MNKNSVNNKLIKFMKTNYTPKIPLKVLKEHAAHIHSITTEMIFQIFYCLKRLKYWTKKILSIIFALYHIHS